MDALNAADWAILTVIGLSMLLSLLRGFVREALSLVAWVAAFLIAMVFSTRASSLLESSIAEPTGRYIVAFASLFVLTLLVFGIIARLLRSAVEFAGLGVLDRLLGMAFGFARGVFLFLVIVTIARPTVHPEQFAWWGQSVLLPHLLLMEGWFQEFTRWLSGFLAGMGH